MLKPSPKIARAAGVKEAVFDRSENINVDHATTSRGKIFDDTETEARRICEVRPKSSSFGNLRVAA